MKISWRALIKRKFAATSDFFAVGIAVDEDFVAFSVLKSKGEDLELVNETIVSTQQWTLKLTEWVDQFGLNNTPTYVAFSSSYYQLHQIDRPAVEDQEMLSALKWSVQELSGQDSIKTFDYFDAPVPLSGSQRTNIVTVDETKIKEVANACFVSGLDLKEISVEEVVLCNLTETNNTGTLLLVQDGNDEVCLVVVKDGQLYLSRELKGFENLSSLSLAELDMGIIESLCVQIQRSMDYFESQLRQAPIRHIQLKLNTQHLEQLRIAVGRSIPVQVDVLHPPFQVEEDVDPLRISYLAAGAALSHKKQGQVAT